MGEEDGGFDAFMASMGDAASTQETSNGKVEKDYEEQQEDEAMMRHYHVPMKRWFRDTPALEEKYGKFPIFWQDLKQWPHYRVVLKEYLKSIEGGSTADTSEGTDVKSSDPKDTTNGEKPRKKRKSRWGDPDEQDTAASTSEDAKKKKRKSRWAPAPAVAGAGLNGALSEQNKKSVELHAKLDDVNARLQSVASDAARIEKDPNRSPSPPPQYDSNGKRTNTREDRMRESIEKERQFIIEELVRINPLFRPPSDYMKLKLHRKIYIPQEKYPGYNFIGLIIGPRGNTQKRMEKESNCKIAIRGKGSIKEGSKKKQTEVDENDELHVLITGPTQACLDKAAEEVQKLLVPLDDTLNAHKQKQLRELALINGTLRDDDYCHICGEKGHRQWECPNREKSFKRVEVKCAICGDSSHPTSDCTMKGANSADNAAIDEEYASFMEQLGETTSTAKTEKTSATPNAASAPWLKPSKAGAAAATAQPWTNQPAGAPGTAPGTAPGVAPAPVAQPAAPTTYVYGPNGWTAQTPDGSYQYYGQYAQQPAAYDYNQYYAAYQQTGGQPMPPTAPTNYPGAPQ